MSTLAYLIATPLAGWLADRPGARRGALMAAGLALAGGGALATGTPSGVGARARF